MFENLSQYKNFKAKRISSYDKTGGNADRWVIDAQSSRTIADIEGPGKISHIWCTIFGKWGEEDKREFDTYSLRKVLIRMYWDDEKEPSVDCPIGDFFGLGHARAYSYQCAFFNTSCNDSIEGTINPRIAMNCWIPMPFRKKARIEVVNEQDINIIIYFYVDYQEHKEISTDTLYFHAQWKREKPVAIKDNGGVNLTDKNNYLILEAFGKGHYIGTNMSIDNTEGNWWGEGDDMIFVDRDNDDKWPPDLHGTGSEDYLCHAWGMQKVSHLYSGQPWCEYNEYGNTHHNKGKVCVYRYHVIDPIPFKKSIRVSIEHGHANDRGDDISSVAYWYQDEPHTVFVKMIPAEKRIPEERR
ncbi:MAG: DUF2961 domain-containing protein [Clostridiaceae bacterium]|nr:DUF2961 domain-containing protein [Clostridiaceae bacterium]